MGKEGRGGAVKERREGGVGREGEGQAEEKAGRGGEGRGGNLIREKVHNHREDGWRHR